jgi:hypothetical protein
MPLFKNKFYMICRFCEKEIGINEESIRVKEGNITTICPNPKCKKEIHLREAKAKCPCGHVNDVFIPEGMQVSETHLIEGERNKGVFGSLHFSELETKCDGCESRFHIVIIKGEKSACIVTGGKGCEDINQSILGRGAKCSLNSSFMIKRLGEFVFCLLTGFLLATLATISICLYSIFLGALFGGCLYVSFLFLNETVIVCGELETKFRDNMKWWILIPFFVFRKMIFLFLLIPHSAYFDINYPYI